jgi:hypothetical protein
MLLLNCRSSPSSLFCSFTVGRPPCAVVSHRQDVAKEIDSSESTGINEATPGFTCCQSCPVYLSLSRQQNGPFLAPGSETKAAGHAYQLCQPSNGRTDRTEVGRTILSDTHQEQAAIQIISKEATPDRPATRPRGPRHTTVQPSRNSFRPGISTNHNPWRYTAALQPNPAAHHTSTPPASTQHSTTRPHESHPATQHTGRGKTHALKSDNYAKSTL